LIGECIPREIFMAIINSTYNAIIIIDKEGRIVAFNKQAEKITGVQEEDVLSHNIREVIPNTGLLQVLKTGMPEISKKIKINGFICVSHRTPIIYDSGVQGAMVIFQDISQLEEITKELKTYTFLVKELEAIVESSSDGIYVTDGDGYTIRVNSAYEEITGIKRDEVLGKHMQDLVEQGFYSQSVTLLVLRNKESTTIMQRIKDNKDVMVTGSPVMDSSGQIKFVVTSVRDVTNLTRLQQELQNTKALSDKYHEELKSLKQSNLVAKSHQMIDLLGYARQVAPYPTTVLIQGESGVGKELIAEFIHNNSKRAGSNFIKVNCGAIPENLVESELFGYEGGAFTGAQSKGKPGMFELAHHGTILLDEVVELSPELQVKLLRVLQENEVTRVGGLKPKRINARVIAATNKDLEKMSQGGMFREDLFYRLNVIKINVPPLRERPEDIMLLANHFLDTFNVNYSLGKKFSLEVKDYFENYSWRGNVRELKNLIENLVVSIPGDTITGLDLPYRMTATGWQVQRDAEEIIPLQESVKRAEINSIKKALQETNSLREASKLLRVSHSTLSRKVHKYNMGHLLQ